jgi:hypothetical protein
LPRQSRALLPYFWKQGITEMRKFAFFVVCLVLPLVAGCGQTKVPDSRAPFAVVLAPTPHTPIQSPDGFRTTFTLPSAPSSPTSVFCFLAGAFVPYGTAFTISGATVTWTGTPPEKGASFVIFY